MGTLQIGKLAVRCHVSGADAADGARVARLFHERMTAAMDDAMTEARIDPHEEVCIRRLVVPARFWLGFTDEALVSSWVSALAVHMRRALATFRRAGLNAVPAIVVNPISVQTWRRTWVPTRQTLEFSQEVVHDYIGYAWYWFRGWT